jgi:hypothetical protein
LRTVRRVNGYAMSLSHRPDAKRSHAADHIPRLSKVAGRARLLRARYAHARRVSTQNADRQIDRLAKKYLDEDIYPFHRPDRVRNTIKIAPEKINEIGLEEQYFAPLAPLGPVRGVRAFAGSSRVGEAEVLRRSSPPSAGLTQCFLDVLPLAAVPLARAVGLACLVHLLSSFRSPRTRAHHNLLHHKHDATEERCDAYPI